MQYGRIMQKTQFSTIIADGVEYNIYPPPEILIKVMKREFAQDLVDKGYMHFGDLEYYRGWENKVLGDKNDGLGMYRMAGHEYNSSSSNPIFAWCSSLSTVQETRISEIASVSGYDCKVIISNPSKMIQRLYATVQSVLRGVHIHCGPVNYDRGDEVDKDSLNDQPFNFNVFQKDERFADDNEYRVSLMLNRPITFHFYVISVGSCSDIMTIEPV